ncbi:MAG: MOSC domain-containing protein [Actinomycetota bacterium]
MVKARFPLVVGNHRYTATDARRTLASFGALWEHHSHATALSAEVCDMGRDLASVAASAAGVTLPITDDVGALLETAGAGCSDRFETLSNTDLEGILATTWEVFSRTRDLTVTHHGTVSSMHAGRGLPKPGVDGGVVSFGGLEGDVQRARTHHGRPQQALCLWTTDALGVLRSEGHPIGPGCAGENIVLDGIPRDAVRPGARLVIGGVEAFVSSYAIPCKKNIGWFADGDFMRMHHHRGDESRFYAMVTGTGRIDMGDAVTVISDR